MHIQQDNLVYEIIHVKQMPRSIMTNSFIFCLAKARLSIFQFKTTLFLISQKHKNTNRTIFGGWFELVKYTVMEVVPYFGLCQ